MAEDKHRMTSYKYEGWTNEEFSTLLKHKEVVKAAREHAFADENLDAANDLYDDPSDEGYVEALTEMQRTLKVWKDLEKEFFAMFRAHIKK